MNAQKVSSIYILKNKDDLKEFWTIIPIHQNTMRKINKIYELIGYPLTVVYEETYVDRVYRDSYYSYFASKYLNIPRNCNRLSLFKGIIEPEQFKDYCCSNTDTMNQQFVGIIVLRPLKKREIGRTLLDPLKLSIEQCYARTTEFHFIILGHDLSIQAYPFASQDAETMTCAETTIWSILEYYGNRYAEYKTILPSDIIKELDRYSIERDLPSIGLDYYTVSELLKTFGFSPKIYARKAYSPKEYHRIFHYYIESGIPIAIGISGKHHGKKIGHSIVGIGHAAERKALTEISLEKIDEIPIVDSADFYDKYVIMDDNQIPYTVESYSAFTQYENTFVDIFDVPLYKRIFLEASDAATNVKEILSSKNILRKCIDESRLHITQENPVILRLYLTSSRKYKKIRASNSQHDAEKMLYSNILCPKFLWVAELATFEGYQKEEIFGEIILDATASKSGDLDNLILLRYFSHVGIRMPSENTEILLSRFSKNTSDFVYPYPMYKNNLGIGGKRHDSI